IPPAPPCAWANGPSSTRLPAAPPPISAARRDMATGICFSISPMLLSPLRIKAVNRGRIVVQELARLCRREEVRRPQRHLHLLGIGPQHALPHVGAPDEPVLPEAVDHPPHQMGGADPGLHHPLHIDLGD